MTISAYSKYESYKDSGVDWLGEIPTHWNVRRAGFLLNELNSRSKDGSEPLLSLSKSLGVIRRDSMAERGGQAESLVGYKQVTEGNIVINRMQAANGLLSVSKISGITSPDYAIFETKKNAEIRSDIAALLLQQPEYQGEIKRSVKGVMEGFIRLYSSELFRLPLICAPLPEQRAIAAFLDTKCGRIDEAVRIKEEQIALLKERRQILIQQAVTRGLNPDAPMKDSGIDGLGKIPSHWEVVFNRRLFRENSRKITQDETPLSLSQVDGVIPSEDMKERSLSPSHRDNFKLCIPDDLVVNRFKGHLGVFFRSPYRGIVTFHYGVFEPDKTVATKYYELLYHTECYKVIYAGASNGMTIGLQNLSNLNFYRVKSPRPPRYEQIEIVNFISEKSRDFDEVISLKANQIAALKEYKKSLINAAVTGKIKVS